MMANKMKELDMKETSSKSLLSNVLDMDDDFRSTTLPTSAPVHHPSHVTGHQNAGFVRSVSSILSKIRFLKLSIYRNTNGLEKILGLDERYSLFVKLWSEVGVCRIAVLIWSSHSIKRWDEENYGIIAHCW